MLQQALGSTKVNRAKTHIVTPNYVLPLLLNLLLPLVLNLFCKQYLSILDNQVAYRIGD